MIGTRGAVATSNWLASAAGMAALASGGNAFDAAVTAAFVLQVVEPHQNGPGGDVCILLMDGATNKVEVLSGQGPAPGTASIAHFRDLGLDLIPGTGLLPACVPGAVDAWLLMLQENGTMELSEVLDDAIGYAERGYPVTLELQEAIRETEDYFRQHWTFSAEIYLPTGVPDVGQRISNQALSATFKRLLAEARGSTRENRIRAARRAWSHGFVAEAVEEFVLEHEVMDDTGSPHRGLITADDMSKYQAGREPPVPFRYRDNTVYKAPAWSQGPVFLQQLALLQGFDISSTGSNSVDFIHLVVEAAKLAFADREAWYGDPHFTDVPMDELLSIAYNEHRQSLISHEASAILRPGSPSGASPRLPRAVAPLAPARDLPSQGDTCLVAVADTRGNLVTGAPSGGWIRSSPVIPGLGFPLGTRAQMFWLEEGLASSLVPGSRPRTTLSPTIASTSQGRHLAFGTPGGDKQDQVSLLFFLGLVDFGFDLQQSIDVAAFHTLHFPSSFYPRESQPGKVVVEKGIDKGVLDELRSRGHLIDNAGRWDVARTCAVRFDVPKQIFEAGVSNRGIQAHAAVR